MGLFEKAGRKFEQFKQTAESTAEEEIAYECTACGNGMYTEHDACPDCGSEEIASLATADGSEPAEDPSEESDSK